MDMKLEDWPYSKEEYLKKIVGGTRPFPEAESKFHLHLITYIGHNCSWLAELELIDHHDSDFDYETILFHPTPSSEIYLHAVRGGTVETIIDHINQTKSIH